MIKKIFLLSLLGLALAFGGCRKNPDIEELPKEQKTELINGHNGLGSADSLIDTSDEYISLELLVDDENEQVEGHEDLRTFFYVDGHLPKFSFGPEGTKVNVRTELVVRTERSGVSVLNNIYLDERASWTVAPGGRRLTYSGQIKVLKSAIAEADKLYLVASVLSKDATSPRVFFSTPIHEVTTSKVGLDLDIPYVAVAELERIGTEGRRLRPKALSKPIFRPLGEMACFSVKNDSDEPIGFRGLGGANLYAKSAITINTDPSAIDVKSGTLLLDESPIMVISTLPSEGLKIWVKELESSGDIMIAPGQTKYFVAWSPRFVDTSDTPERVFSMIFGETLTSVYQIPGSYLPGHAGLITWGVDVRYTKSAEFEVQGRMFGSFTFI